MLTLMKEGEPEMVIALVPKAQLDECLVGRQPSSRPAKARFPNLGRDHEGYAGSCEKVLNVGDRLRERLSAGKASDLTENVTQSGSVERLRLDLSGRTLSPSQPCSHSVWRRLEGW
jgi:hypothetical protein